MGTRFAVTNESMLSEEKKQRYLAAKAADTQRTRLFDDLGPVDWPTGVDGRVIGNTFSNTHGTIAPAEVDTDSVLLIRGVIFVRLYASASTRTCSH